jgi:hypothetical protein
MSVMVIRDGWRMSAFVRTACKLGQPLLLLIIAQGQQSVVRRQRSLRLMSQMC